MNDLPVQLETDTVLSKMPLTSGAEWAIIGSGGTVTQVAVVPLHTLPSISAIHPKTGAVALATRLDPRCNLGPLFQV